MFEQIYSIEWLTKKPRYTFLLGMFYSLLGIVTALLLFPEDPSLASLAFTTIAIVPSLNRLLLQEENEESKFKKFSVRKVFTCHKDIFQIYIFLFFGILFTYSFFSIVLPDLAKQHLFSSQLDIYHAFVGQADNVGATFLSLVQNNLTVLVVFLILSFIYGAGSVFLIAWNASVWGAIFGYIAHQAAAAQGINPIFSFFALFLGVFPHTFLEALGYFGASIAGGVISTAAIREKILSKKFKIIVIDGLFLFLLSVFVVILGAYVESILV